jgi:hypothetical protein
VDSDATDVALPQLDLTGVEAGPDLEVDPGQLVAEGGGAADRPAGAVEGGQNAVAGGLDELTAELLDQPAGTGSGSARDSWAVLTHAEPLPLWPRSTQVTTGRAMRDNPRYQRVVSSYRSEGPIGMDSAFRLSRRVDAVLQEL